MALPFLNSLLPEHQAVPALANSLAEKIITAELLPGNIIGPWHSLEPLPDSKIIDFYWPQAASALEAVGMVRRDAVNQLVVLGVTPHESGDVRDCWLELQSVAIAAALESPESGIGAALAQQRENLVAASSDGSVRQAMQAEFCLWHEIGARSGNRLLVQLLSRLEWQIMRYRFQFYTQSAGVIASACCDLAEFCEALLEGRVVEAIDLLKARYVTWPGGMAGVKAPAGYPPTATNNNLKKGTSR